MEAKEHLHKNGISILSLRCGRLMFNVFVVKKG